MAGDRWDARPGAVLRKAAVTFLDQVSLSAAGFAVGLAFIFAGTPEEFGLYSFFLSVFLFLASAQNAVVNTPLMVLSPRLDGVARARFARGILGVLFVGGAATLLLAPAALLFGPRAGGGPAAALFILCFVPLMLRDFFRADEFANVRPDLALGRDLVYAALTCAGVGALAALGFVRALPAFAVVATASLAVVARPCVAFFRELPAWSEIAGAARASWTYSRWSLVGAASAWVQANAYVYVPFVLLGARQVAFLAAARLVMAPAALLANSWGNLFRPVASRRLFEDDRAAALELFRRSSLALGAIVAAYSAAALLALSLLPASWIPADYRGLEGHILLWAAVLLVQIVRNNASSLLQASLAFRDLALWGAAVAGVAVGATVALVLLLGAAGSLVALIAGEILLMLVLLLEVRRATAPGRRGLATAA